MTTKGQVDTASVWRYVVVVVVAVVLGGLLAPSVSGFVGGLTHQPHDAVAVVSVDGPITMSTADRVREDLRDVRRNESIEAVVLRMNSPGGSVAATESLYLAVNKTATTSPLVASVSQVGASGGYYGILPAERIYVTPASLVGSVGVIASVPQEGSSNTRIVTGPDKGAGSTVGETIAQVETLRRLFVDTVFHHRGSRLQLSPEQLSYAKVYIGSSAVQNGIADRIGGLDTAIADAASRAGLEDYTIVRKSPPPQLGLLGSGSGSGRLDTTDPFGFRGVETTKYLALYGTLTNDSVIVRAD